MADDFTTLNVGAGGSTMDETGVSYPSAPTTRKRPRIVISGEARNAIATVLNTIPEQDEYGIVVRSIVGREFPGNPFFKFDQATLTPSNSEITIATYTVPANKQLFVTGFYVSGDVNAKYSFFYTTTRIMVLRTSVAKPSEAGLFNVVRPIASAGETVAVKVIHEVAGIQANFEATILGYLVDV